VEDGRFRGGPFYYDPPLYLDGAFSTDQCERAALQRGKSGRFTQGGGCPAGENPFSRWVPAGPPTRTAACFQTTILVRAYFFPADCRVENGSPSLGSAPTLAKIRGALLFGPSLPAKGGRDPPFCGGALLFGSKGLPGRRGTSKCTYALSI